jgi:hypothetical protein
LRHDLELCPDLTGLVDDVLKRSDIEIFYEVDNRFEGVSARNTDERDVSAVLSLYLCDRRGFSSADRSPGRPEPQQQVLAT